MGKEIARQQPSKMLEYAGEKAWRCRQQVPSGALGRTGSKSGTFGNAMAAGQGGAGTGARAGDRTGSRRSALSVGAGGREIGGGASMVRCGLAFAGAG